MGNSLIAWVKVYASSHLRRQPAFSVKRVPPDSQNLQADAASHKEIARGALFCPWNCAFHATLSDQTGIFAQRLGLYCALAHCS
jgi:hypothetical protein